MRQDDGLAGEDGLVAGEGQVDAGLRDHVEVDGVLVVLRRVTVGRERVGVGLVVRRDLHGRRLHARRVDRRGDLERRGRAHRETADVPGTGRRIERPAAGVAHVRHARGQHDVGGDAARRTRPVVAGVDREGHRLVDGRCGIVDRDRGGHVDRQAVPDVGGQVRAASIGQRGGRRTGRADRVVRHRARDHPDEVVTARQFGEQVGAVGVRRGRADQDVIRGGDDAIGARFVQLEADVGDADLARVEHTVAVGVGEHEVTDRAGADGHDLGSCLVVLGRRIVARRRVRVVRRAAQHLGGVGDRRCGVDRGRQQQGRTRTRGEVPDRPLTGRVVVGAAGVVADVGQPGRQRVADDHGLGGLRTGVGDLDRERDVVTDDRRGLVDDLGDAQVRDVGRHGRAGAVVARVRVGRVGRRDRHDVRADRRPEDVGGDGQRLDRAEGEQADVPHTAGAVEAAGGRRGPDEPERGREVVGGRDDVGGVRALVGEGDRERDLVADVRRRVVDRLGQPEVRLGGIERRAVLVVLAGHTVGRRRVRVGLVDRSDLGGVGDRTGGSDLRGQLELRGGTDREIADRPRAGRVVVGATGAVADVGELGRELVGDDHGRGVVGPLVGDRDGERHVLADQRRRRVDGLGDREVGRRQHGDRGRVLIILRADAVGRGRVDVGLFCGGDLGRHGLVTAGGRRGPQRQRRGAASRQRADVPRARGGVVGPLPRRGGDEGEAGRQRRIDEHGRCVGGPLVGQRDRERGWVAEVDDRLVDDRRDRQVDLGAVAEVDVVAHLAGAQRHVGGVVRRRQDEPGGDRRVDDVDAVLAGRQIGEEVAAVAVGRVGGDHHVVGGAEPPVGTGCEQSQVDAREAVLTGVLDAVSIAVVEDGVADRRGCLHDDRGVIAVVARVGVGLVERGHGGGVVDRASGRGRRRDRQRGAGAEGEVTHAPHTARGVPGALGGAGAVEVEAGRQHVAQGHRGGVARTEVADGDGPDHGCAVGRCGLVDGLGHHEVRGLPVQGDGLLVVLARDVVGGGRVDVDLVGRRDLCDVRDGAGGVDRGLDRDRAALADRQVTDRPDPGAGVVGAGVVGDVGHLGRQQALDLDARRVGGAVVGHGDRERDGVTDVRRGGVDGLGQRDVDLSLVAEVDRAHVGAGGEGEVGRVVRGGEHQARRHGARVHGHAVVTRCERRELVLPAAGRRRGRQCRVVRGPQDAVGAGAGQEDVDAVDARLASVLETVTVEVLEDRVADACRGDHVQLGVVLVVRRVGVDLVHGCHGRGVHDLTGGLDVGRDGQRRAGTGRERTDVPAAVDVGVRALPGHGADERETGGQLVGQHDPGRTGRAGVGDGEGELDLVTDERCRVVDGLGDDQVQLLLVAEVDVEDRRGVRRQRHPARVVGGRQHEAGRHGRVHHVDAVVTCRQAVEEVVPRAARRGRRTGVVPGVEQTVRASAGQGERDATDTRLAGVLDAVAVEVLEDRVTDAAAGGDRQRRRVLVVLRRLVVARGRVGVELVGRGHLRAVGHVPGDRGHHVDGERAGQAERDVADRPGTRHRVVRADACAVGVVGHAGRQDVGDLDVGRRVGTAVRHLDRVGRDVASGHRAGSDGLDDRQVRLLRGQSGAGGVVGVVGVERVRRDDLGGVRDRSGRVDGGVDRQRLTAPERQRGQVPHAVGRVERAVGRGVRDVGEAGQQVINRGDRVRRVGPDVAQHDRERDRVPDVGCRVVDRLVDREVRRQRVQRRAVLVVLALRVVGRGRVRIELVAGQHLCDVGLRRALVHGGLDGQRGGLADRQRSDVPDAGRGVEGASAVVGDVGHTGRQVVADGHARRRVRPGVADRHGPGDGVPVARRRVVDRLGHRQVSRDVDRDNGVVRVVLGQVAQPRLAVRVDLVSRGDLRDVRQVAGRRDVGDERQRPARGACGDVADGPHAGRVVVAAVRRRRRHEGKACRERVVDRHARRVRRPHVVECDRERDGVAQARGAVVDGLGQFEVGLLLVAEVDVEAVLPHTERDVGRVVRRGQDEARRHRAVQHVHAVVAGVEQVEQVAASAVGGVRGRDHVVGGAERQVRAGREQLDHDADDAGLTDVLDTVAVEVLEDRVPDAGRDGHGDGGVVAVIARVVVELVQRRDRGGVGDRARVGDVCGDRQRRGAADEQVTDGPHATGAVVGALRRGCRDQRDSGGQLVGDGDAGRVVTAGVEHRDGELDLVTDRRRGVVDALAHGEVGDERRDGDVVLVVLTRDAVARGGVDVRLVGRRDLRDVVRVGRVVDRGDDVQRHRGTRGDRADRPLASGVAVSARSVVTDVAETAREQVGDHDVRCIVGADVGHRHGERDGVADVRTGRVHDLGQFEVDERLVAEVDGQVAVVVAGERHQRRVVGRRQLQVIGQRRRVDRDPVVTRGQPVEAVVAVGAGHVGRRDVVTGVQQPVRAGVGQDHGDAGDPVLGRVLDPVTVHVEEHRVPDRTDRCHRERRGRLVVRRIGVGLVDVGQDGRVVDRPRIRRRDEQRERRAGARRDVADGPRAACVAALRRCRRVQHEAGRQHVGDLDAGRVDGRQVLDPDRPRCLVARVDRGRRDGLGDLEVDARLVAEVRGQVLVAVTHERHVDRVGGRRQDEAGRHRPVGHIHAIGPGTEPGEVVGARAVGRRGPGVHVVGGPEGPVGSCLGQRQLDATDAGLAAALDAVAVVVTEDRVADAPRGAGHDSGLGLVVLGQDTVARCRVGVELVAGDDLGDVGERAARVDGRGDLQGGRGTVGECADGPLPGGGVVRTRTVVTDVAQPGRELVADDDVVGRGRSVVGDLDREHDRVASVRGPVVHDLREAQVGLLAVAEVCGEVLGAVRGQRHAGRVVGRGQHEPGRHGPPVDGDLVGASGQAGELVEATTSGRGRRGHVVRGAERPVRARSGQHEADPVDPGLARVLHAVTVEVLEDGVADAAGCGDRERRVILVVLGQDVVAGRRVRVELVGRADLGDVRDGPGVLGSDVEHERGGRAVGQRADGPDPTGERALRRCRGVQRHAGGHCIGDLDVGGVVGAVVGQRDREGRRSARGDGARCDGLVQAQIGALRRHADRRGVIDRVRVERVRRDDLGGVADRVRRVDRRDDRQGLAGPVRQGVDVPDPVGRVEGAARGRVRDVRQARQQVIEGRDRVRGVRPLVAQADGERDRVTDVRRGVVDGLGDAEVGRQRVQRGLVLVVLTLRVVAGRGVGVVLVAGLDLGHVGLRCAGVDARDDLQRHAAAGRDGADGPDPGRGVEVTAAVVADPGDAARQVVADGHVRGVVGPRVADGHRPGDLLAAARAVVVDGLDHRQVCGAGDGDRGRGLVVLCRVAVVGCGVGVGLVDTGDLGHVRDHAGPGDLGDEAERGGATVDEVADSPHVGRGDVAALTRCRERERHPGRQGIGDLDVGRVRRPVVGQRQRVGDVVTERRGRVVDGLLQPQVRLDLVAEVDVEAVLPHTERQRGRVVGRGQHVAGGDGRGVDLDPVVARSQQVEQVCTGAIGHVAVEQDVVGRVDQAVRARAVQLHADTREPELAQVLDAVAVEVDEDHVTDARRRRDRDVRAVVVVGRVVVELVTRGDGSRVGQDAVRADIGREGQGDRVPERQCADGPHPARAVVGALARHCVDEVEPGRQRVTDGHASGGVGPVVRERHGEHDGVTDVGRRVVDGLGHGQVGDDRVQRRVVLVVLARDPVGGGRVDVVLVGGRHLGDVDGGIRVVERRRDGECLRRTGGEGADAPHARSVVVGASSVVTDVRDAGRQLVGDRHTGCVVGADVADSDREDDLLAVHGPVVVDRLRQLEVHQRLVAEVGIEIGRVVGGQRDIGRIVGRGERQVVGQRRRVDLDAVVTGREAAEAVDAGPVGDVGRKDLVVGRVEREVGARAQQCHRDAADAALAATLDTVAVGVEEDGVTDRARRLHDQRHRLAVVGRVGVGLVDRGDCGGVVVAACIDAGHLDRQRRVGAGRQRADDPRAGSEVVGAL